MPRRILTLKSVPLIAAVTILAAGSPAHSQQPIEKLASKLSGTWNEVLRANASCLDKKYFHTFSLSADGFVLTRRYVVPFEGVSGVIAEERYRVVYGDETSVVLFREGETFEHRDSGDKVLRQLILDSEDTYAWRLYGTPRDFRAAGGGLRCTK